MNTELNNELCESKTISDELSGIRNLAVSAKLTPAEIFEIWSSGIGAIVESMPENDPLVAKLKA